MLRKMAFCKDCNCMRRIEVELVCVVLFNPTNGHAYIHDFDSVIARCAICYSSVHLSIPKEQLDELLKETCNVTSDL